MAVAKSIAPSASLRAGTNGCATRVLGDLKVAATNAKPKRAGQARPYKRRRLASGGGPYKCQRGVLGKVGGNEVQPEARLMGSCEGTEGRDARE